MQDARDPSLPLDAAVARLNRATTEPDLLAAVQRLQKTLDQIGSDRSPEMKVAVLAAGEAVKQALRRARAPGGDIAAATGHPQALAAYRTMSGRR